jgi:hypothetical protein
MLKAARRCRSLIAKRLGVFPRWTPTIISEERAADVSGGVNQSRRLVRLPECCHSSQLRLTCFLIFVGVHRGTTFQRPAVHAKSHPKRPTDLRFSLRVHAEVRHHALVVLLSLCRD